MDAQICNGWIDIIYGWACDSDGDTWQSQKGSLSDTQTSLKGNSLHASAQSDMPHVPNKLPVGVIYRQRRQQVKCKFTSNSRMTSAKYHNMRSVFVQQKTCV